MAHPTFLVLSFDPMKILQLKLRPKGHIEIYRIISARQTHRIGEMQPDTLLGQLGESKPERIHFWKPAQLLCFRQFGLQDRHKRSLRLQVHARYKAHFKLLTEVYFMSDRFKTFKVG